MLQSPFSSPAFRPCALDQIPEAPARHQREGAAPLVIREMQLLLKRHSAINTLLLSLLLLLFNRHSHRNTWCYRVRTVAAPTQEPASEPWKQATRRDLICESPPPKLRRRLAHSIGDESLKEGERQRAVTPGELT